jgi:rhamnosyltransferase
MLSTQESNSPLKDLGVVIPTFNAERHFKALTAGLDIQGISRSQVWIIDSSSTDRSADLFREYGARVTVIPQAAFNHGGTRRLATQLAAGSSHFVFMTQDAIPGPKAFEKLLRAFDEPAVGAAYGRQLPRPDAKAMERHARLFNYPASGVTIRVLADRSRLGVKTAFCSNSFAAYRAAHLEAVGGFPEESFFGEDQVVSGKMLLAGYKVAYVGDAEATHSHGYSMMDEFRRFFDVGVFHHRNRWLLQEFGKAEGEGLKFIRSELDYLSRHEPLSIPAAMIRTLLKYLGYRLGFIETRLSNSLKRKISLSPYYWRESAAH